MKTPLVHYERFPFKYRVIRPPGFGERQTYSVAYETYVKGYAGSIHDKVSGAMLARLTPDGVLTVYEGAPWDGPSGPAVDSPDFMDASLAHDYLYHGIALGIIPKSERKNADLTLIYQAQIHGMSWTRRQWVYWGVRIGGGSHTDETIMVGRIG